jgi:hypothetical protein
MTNNEIQIEVAKVDGWKTEHHINQWDSEAQTHRSWINWIGPDGEVEGEPPDYLTSRDAIVSVIEKVLGNNEELWSRFLHKLGLLVGFHKGMEVPRFDIMRRLRFLLATPKQLCIALLNALGKWKE